MFTPFVALLIIVFIRAILLKKACNETENCLNLRYIDH